MSKPGHILGMLAAALDRGEGTRISPDDVLRHIEHRDLFAFLDEELPSFRSRYLLGPRGEPTLEAFGRLLSDPTGTLQGLSVHERDLPKRSGLALLVLLATAALHREALLESAELRALRSKRLVLFTSDEDSVYAVPGDSDASSCVYVARGERSVKFRLDPFRVLQNNGCGGSVLEDMTRLVQENHERIARIVGGMA